MFEDLISKVKNLFYLNDTENVDQDSRARRLLQLLWLSESMLVISIIFSFSNQIYNETIAKTVVALTFLVVFPLIKSNKIDLASAAFLWISTFSFSYLIWIDAGVRDSGMVAFPGILLYAAALGMNRNFLFIFIYIIFYISLMVHANLTGWHIHEVRTLNLAYAIDIFLMYTAICAAIWILISDLKFHLSKSIAEREKVLSSNAIIDHLVNHDLLTGLPNRLLAKDRFEQAYLHAKNQGWKIGLLSIDLDNFQTLNDSLGHEMGDELIRKVADRLLGICPEGTTVCRLGGDEFLLIIEALDDKDIVFEIAIEILNQMSLPFSLDSIQYVCTCSLGISICPDDEISFDTLLKKANLALDRAKETSKNRFVFYDQKMDIDTQAQLNLLLELRSAIQQNQFELYYQPKISLTDHSVLGFEALIRWNHPYRGLISPLAFIPIAETFGLIVGIGDWVLEEACRQCKQWHDQGYDTLSIAVNVSSVQFKRGNIEDVVMRALKNSNLPPRFLEVEMTESMLIDDSTVLSEALNRLHKLGVKFSLDDFGTGYSNLGYLKKFRITVLKIDQSFIKKMSENLQDEAIVKAVIQMAAAMNMTTVAEGIEDVGTQNKLIELNCNYAQGYLWSKPLPANMILSYLVDAKNRQLPG
jgi:diguanylate cyclase (GGDEF)-like protein